MFICVVLGVGITLKEICMDITLPVLGYMLNLRVAILLEMPGGLVFEKHPQLDYYVLVGGRIKIGETSLECVQRELYEELGITVTDLRFSTLLENFFEEGGVPYHEINILYTASTQEVVLPQGFVKISRAELAQYNIKPTCLKTMLQAAEIPVHRMYREL